MRTAKVRAERWRARLAMLVSFSSFFVFPAIPVGHTGALTIPFAIAAVAAVFWLPRLAPSEWGPFAWMIGPAVVSGSWVLLAGAALAPEIVPKSVASMAMPFVVVIPALRLLRDGHGDHFLLGAAWAILVHAAAGAYQVVSFDRGVFPFAELMRTNPGMALLTEDAPIYAEYVKRPFGLFAEPSAMAACLGPWLILIACVLFGRGRGAGKRTILALSLAGGLALVVKSKTGLSVPIVGGCVVAALAGALSWRQSVGVRAVALAVSVAIAVASVMWLSENAGARFDLNRNDSWQGRLASLELSVRWIGASVDSASRFLVGLGPGQSFPAINSTYLKYETGGGVTAVWSVGLSYAMETGLLGIVAMIVLGASAARSVWVSRARLAGTLFAVAWLSGISVGTSYMDQPSLWTGLAALLAWPSLTSSSF